MELRVSSNRFGTKPDARVETGRRWRTTGEVGKVTARLKHQEMVDIVQTGQAGLGWSNPPPCWFSKQKSLVVGEARMKSVPQV